MNDDDRFVKAIYERVVDQMRHAEYYTRPESGVLRFMILPTDLNALLKFVADKTGVAA